MSIPLGRVEVAGISDMLAGLMQIQRQLANITESLTNSYISLAGTNVFTGQATFTLPPNVGAGALGATTFQPMGLVSKQYSAAGVGNGADLTDDTLFSYTLPANAMDANGRTVIIDAFGKFAANGNNKTVKLWFGTSLVFSSGVLTNNNVGWAARLIVGRTGAATQIGQGTGMAGSTPFPVPIPPAGTETLSGAVVIKVTGASPTTGAASDVVGNGMLITFAD